MSNPKEFVSSSTKENFTLPPWLVQLCRRIWKISGSLGLLSLATSLIKYVNKENGLVFLLLGCCLGLLTLLVGIIGHWQLDDPDALMLRNRRRMLQRLHRTYHDLFARSLQDVTWLELTFSQRFDILQNLADEYPFPGRAEQILPPGTSITQVYEEANHELLLLGEPGSGKSTLLIHLAQWLVEQAEQDEAQPLPVILPLSSWAESRLNIQDWMVEQIAQIYDVQRPLAEQWVQNGHILPLLDGLDEMNEQFRSACIAAIKAYHHKHPGPLVVCSRRSEYEEAARHQKLVLQSAVVVQPLSGEQVENYLIQAGEPLSALHRVLNKNSALQELATTPLMFCILIRTYYGTSIRGASRTKAQLQQHIWETYVQRMVEQKGSSQPVLKSSWLCWLARQMRDHNQTVFYVEHLQPSWLTPSLQRVYELFAVCLPSIFIGMLISSIIIQAIFPSFSYLYHGAVTLLGGLLGGLLCENHVTEQSSEESASKIFRARLSRRLCVGIPIGLVIGLAAGFLQQRGGLTYWYTNGAVWGLSSFLLFLLPLRRYRVQKDISTHISTVTHFIKSSRSYNGLFVGVLIWSIYAVGYGLSYEYRIRGITEGLRYGVVIPGVTASLLGLILLKAGTEVQLVDQIDWSWHSLRSLLTKEHLIETLGGITLIAMILGLSYSEMDVAKGLREVVLIIMLLGPSCWLLLGLYNGVASGVIEDQHRIIPNQGIYRSCRNSLILGVVSMIITGIVIALCIPLSLVVYNALGPKALRDAVLLLFQRGAILAVFVGLLVGLLNGGLTCLRHYILRFLLWRSKLIPRNYAHFLDEATQRLLLRRVGGGYIFLHQLLRDYFADLENPMIDNQQTTNSVPSPVWREEPKE